MSPPELRKVYVEVTVRIDPDGKKRPLTIKFEDQKTYEVDKLKHIIERRASKVGGTGKCYQVVILGKETVLYEEDEGKWFVEAIKQRHNTLSSTMQAIVDYQREYFIDGDETHLKPMVLKDIAEKTGFDISTISRVVNSKYIETHFGIYSLKYFFSEGLENQDGEEVSTRELKKALQECVDNEDKRKPLTDDELVDEMTAKGYKVARRTIAKYRDQLGIPKARLRKEL